MKYALLLPIVLVACSQGPPDLPPPQTMEVIPDKPAVTCRTIKHPAPPSFDFGALLTWALKEIDKSDAMVSSCVTGVSRLNRHIKDFRQ